MAVDWKKLRKYEPGITGEAMLELKNRLRRIEDLLVEFGMGIEGFTDEILKNEK